MLPALGEPAEGVKGKRGCMEEAMGDEDKGLAGESLQNYLILDAAPRLGDAAGYDGSPLQTPQLIGLHVRLFRVYYSG